ncbi:MAG: class I SAM-dependent methyltransferase, partial [Ignavibacteriales bacterium]
MNLSKEDREYSTIFDQRGRWYHQAMMKIPDSRDNEFKLMFKGISFKSGDTVLDFPSGGGYLKHYLHENIKVHELEASEAFAKINNCEISSWSNIPFPDKKFDYIFCCASLHHVGKENRRNFFSEAFRLLKPCGILCLADIDKNEPVALFLNEYVHKNNSIGHEGIFLTSKSASQFADKKFKVFRNELCRYKWYLHKNIFSSLDFLKLMFGMDKAKYKEMKQFLKEQLNLCKDEDDRWTIDWS